MKSLILFVAILLIIAPAAMAEQHEGDIGGQMPEMGPPAEMKQLASMVGTWQYAGEMRMMPQDTTWIKHTADIVISYVAGNAALQMTYTGDMMGMTMHGLSLTTYDREMKQWQEIWVDNFGGRISLDTGTFTDGVMVFSGSDTVGGQTFYTRTTTYDITESSFNWKMENSNDGKDWYVSMKGIYTRQK